MNNGVISNLTELKFALANTKLSSVNSVRVMYTGKDSTYTGTKKQVGIIPLSYSGTITFTDNIKLATTKAIVDYIATTPNPETLAQTLIAGQVTGGKDIIVSAGDDITFTDTSKIILGTGSDATIEHDGTDLKIVNTEGKTTISNSSGDIDISATAATKKLNLNGTAGVELQFGTGKRLETLLGGAKVSGAFEATGIGTLNGIVNTNSYTDSSGDTGTAGQNAAQAWLKPIFLQKVQNSFSLGKINYPFSRASLQKLLDKAATAEKVVNPPQKPGSKKFRRFSLPRRCIKTSKKVARATPIKLAVKVALRPSLSSIPSQ